MTRHRTHAEVAPGSEHEKSECVLTFLRNCLP